MPDHMIRMTGQLVTNAVLASLEARQPVIHLSLVPEPDRVLIFVRDYAAREPEPRHAGTDDEGGRGLTLVGELSDRFGWYPPADNTPGKVVWAAVRAETSAGMNLT
jgi:anti-sigma regulatory factor (Ser/Thr protein kinase)